MAGAFQYAYPGPPFHFMGTFTLSQWNALKTWVNSRSGDVAEVSTFHRIRAEQLRKTAGVMEQYYSTIYPKESGTYNNETLAPTFQKAPWKPGQYGAFSYTSGDDQLPMYQMSKVKTRLREMFQRHEDAIYYMNQIRCLIERHEDLAQYAYDFVQQPSTVQSTATPTDPQTLQDIITRIDSYFSKPEYQDVLVDDVNAGNMYQGQPYFRVHPADEPTAFELYLANHSPEGFPIGIVDRGVIVP